ncbi:glycosyltransferase family 2 protein [Cystobasidium minutum MCA 4210]|uniref:glycosyltransferase family 2 protein n=1 Tax=Cystobasidium minutum MCA 4210 TaxID=1397322 RepID=UPI0034CD1C65|eukprot:jgi/Rhomi1/140855/e_gw1.2.704.1
MQSDIGHQYSDGGLYASRTANNSTGYVDAPLYHPSSPSSAQSHNTYGRFRTGSYPGLESSRTSSIGTHDGVQGANLPYNTSRTALNNEWRQSVDTSHEINALNTPNEKYRDFGTPETEKDGKSYLPIPPSSPALGASAEKGGAPVPPAGGATDGKKPEAAVVLSRVNRLAWIDGLRGLASIVIFTHHYKTLTWEIRYPNVLADGSVQGFITNGQLAVCLYFLLGGRVLAHGFQRSAYAPPKVAKDSHGAVIPGAPLIRSAGPKWLSLSSSLFRRSIRLAFPAIAVGFIQWQVCKTGGTTTAIQANLEFLRPTNLWEATWCEIGDFAGFLQFCLDLFTNQNHQWILYVGSALWTTYDQFWGSVMVYILAAMMAPMAWKGRYALFTVICVSLWYISSPNMLYAMGLWLSDLHASGFVRKLQDHWKPTVAIEVCVMALALAMIAGGGTVATPANDAVGHITINNGRFGWNPDFAWPQYMFMSNWIPALCIMIWLEVSHAMQWFVSWGLFVWIGKVSYGFYLMQFLTLYGLMPHLILALDNGSRSYWDVVTPTFIICLMFNFFVAWIAYHVLDRIGLKLGKWIWDGFFVTKPKNAGAMPLKFARYLGDLVVHGPARAVKGTGKNVSSKWANLKTTVWTIMHWRTRTVRPPIPTPTDPEVLAQLHSTRWTTDISGNKEAMRCHKLLKWQQWSWVFHLFWIPGMTAFWTIYHPTGQWTWDGVTFSTLWRFIWILSLPNCLAGWFGFMTPDWAPTKEQMDKKPVHREHIRNFFIVLVTKGSNESAVRRGYNKLVKLEKYHPAIKTIVLTDEPYVYPDLQNIVCPKDYVSPLGKAKYKARALDYLRYHVSLGVYDWILHMDEESVTDAETVRRCFDFIRYTPHHFGQGIILYNGEGYWENWYFTVADGIRVGDDLARFHFQNTVIQRPVFGVHGSFLMTNGEMENECTWDFGSLAEDFEFSQDAWRRGFTCGRIHGIVREQSPGTLRDFLKQRRRWYMGIRDIKGMYGLPHLAVNLWTVGVFTLAVTIINLPFTLIDKSLTPFWLAICANFCFITFYTIYTWGLLFQELDYGQKWWMIPIHIIPGIIIQPFASISEGLAAIWAMSSEDFGKFEVIQKR